MLITTISPSEHTIPIIPATRPTNIVSALNTRPISLFEAPIARRIPISLVLSRTEIYVIIPISAYKVDSGEFRFVAPNESNSSYRKDNQKAFYEYLRGKTLAQMKWETGSSSSEYVTVETARELSEYLWQRSARIEVGAGKITARVHAEAGEYLFLNFVASKGYRAFVNGRETALSENDLHFLCVALDEGENIVEFRYSSPYLSDMGVGLIGAIVGLCAVAFVERKTKWVEFVSPVIAWAGVLLSIAVVAFFMIFPSAVCVVKLVRLWL